MDLLNILSLITALQLILLSIVVLTGQRLKRAPRRILGSYLIGNSVLLLFFLMEDFIRTPVPAVPVFYFLLAPLLFLYVRSLCQPDQPIDRTDTVHFLLFTASLVYFAIRLGVKVNPEYIRAEHRVSQILLSFQIATYLLLSISAILQHRKNLKNQYSALARIDLSWLLFLLIAFGVMWLVDAASFTLTEFGWIESGGRWILAIVSISINFLFANALVVKGMKHPEVFTGLRDTPKYASSTITGEEISGLSARLKLHMEAKKPYLEPDLSLKDLAEQINVPVRTLSQVINTAFECNFFDFINRHRIEAAVHILRDPRQSDKTILEVLYSVGYNSKSAFHTAFKKQTTMTPTEFRKNSVLKREKGL